MSKIIISKAQITESPEVALIKSFRINNKRAGEYARAGDNINYIRKLQHLGSLQNQALAEYNFNIWVNANGNTGHDYTHDYKESRDTDNDYGAYLLIKNRVDGEFANDSTFGFPKELPASHTASKFDIDSDDDWENDRQDDANDLE